MITEWEASEKRISCRAFQDRQIETDILNKLKDCIKALNAASGLRFQLFASDSPSIRMNAAMFSGPIYTYAALVGIDTPEDAEKVGYYGQQLVLYATQLGLGTCWVAGTYDHDSIAPVLSEGEKVWDVIPMGYAAEKMPMKQKMIRSSIRARSRKRESFLVGDSDAPDWVWAGIEAIMKGPSAVNQQPVNILRQDGKAYAKLIKSGHGLEYNDLGIAKKQFEVGSAHAGIKGHFLPGDQAEFIVE